MRLFVVRWGRVKKSGNTNVAMEITISKVRGVVVELYDVTRNAVNSYIRNDHTFQAVCFVGV